MNTDVIEVEPRATSAALTTTTEIQAGPLAMAMQAMKAGMSIADMRGMLELQKDWEANEARKAYVAAMAAFKLDPPEIFKRKKVGYDNKDGSLTGYMHATLGDVTQAIVNGLAKHGISHRWDTKQEDGRISVFCILTHALGHSEATSLTGQPDVSGKKNGIQQVASTITYLQRYTLLGATGLATKDMEDDDGRGAGGDASDTESVVDGWIVYVNDAATPQALAQIRKEAVTAFNDAGDVAGWNRVKAAIAKQSEFLKEGKA